MNGSGEPEHLTVKAGPFGRRSYAIPGKSNKPDRERRMIALAIDAPFTLPSSLRRVLVEAAHEVRRDKPEKQGVTTRWT